MCTFFEVKRTEINESTKLPKMVCGIYVIKCLRNRKIYIGQAENIRAKVDGYKSQIRNCNVKIVDGNINLDIEKYGCDAFVIDVLTYCNYINLNALERYFIKKYKSIQYGYNRNNGYNTTKVKKYKYTDLDETIIFERKVNTLIEFFREKIFDLDNFDYRYLIKFYDLMELCNLNVNGCDYLLLYDLIIRLDLVLYCKVYWDDNWYKISGSQIWNFEYGVEFKSDKNIDVKKINTFQNRVKGYKKCYVACGKLKCSTDKLINLRDTINNDKVIDGTYDRYKFLDNILGLD